MKEKKTAGPSFLFKAVCKFFEIRIGDIGAQVSAEYTVGVFPEIIAARADTPVEYRAFFDDTQIVSQNLRIHTAIHKAVFLRLDYELLGFLEDGHIHRL